MVPLPPELETEVLEEETDDDWEAPEALLPVDAVADNEAVAVLDVDDPVVEEAAVELDTPVVVAAAELVVLVRLALVPDDDCNEEPVDIAAVLEVDAWLESPDKNPSRVHRFWLLHS
jgi:hypothetical protein